MHYKSEDSPPRSLLEQHRFVEMRLREYRLKIPPGSRLDKESRIFQAAAGLTRTIYKGDPLFLDAIAAKHDLQIFEFILESDGLFETDPIAVRKLKVALLDDVDPQGRINTRGRDTQSELYVGAAIHNAGMSMAFEAEEDSKRPDIRILLDDSEFFVEAKRLKSEARLIERVKDGAKQLDATGRPGALFIDVTLAFNPERLVVERKESDDEFRERHFTWLRARIERHERALFEAIKGTNTTGILFSDHQFRRVTETASGPQALGMEFPNPHSDMPQQAAWLAFIKASACGWWPWDRWSRARRTSPRT